MAEPVKAAIRVNGGKMARGSAFMVPHRVMPRESRSRKVIARTVESEWNALDEKNPRHPPDSNRR
jgi:hypothetical protein